VCGSAVHVSVGDNGGRVTDGHPYSLLQEITENIVSCSVADPDPGSGIGCLF
jgi:hypothetical protein